MCFLYVFLGCILVLFILLLIKIIFFLKNKKNTKTVLFVYIGACVPRMTIETKFSKLCISCSLDEHLNTQLSK